MKEFKFLVNLCGGCTGGEISVQAENEGSAYDKAMALVGEKLTTAFPTLEIDYDVALAEDYGNKLTFVSDLINALTKSDGEQPVLVDDGKGNLIPLQCEFCVEDNTLFLFTEGNNEPMTANQLKWYIECEAEDSCWNNGYNESLFLDCNVVICFGTSELDDSDSKCCTTNFVDTGVNNELVIRCDDTEE